MHPKRFFLTGFGVSLLTLTQCNKSDAPGVVAAPIAAVAAKLDTNSVPLVTEGLSPSFRAVSSHLEVGGCSLNYVETSTTSSWATIIDEIFKTLPESERKGVPPDFSLAKLFDGLGLNSVAAAGSSVHQRADGTYHSRAFAYTPKGRQGLLTLIGGPASKLLLLDNAPKDTDLALELSLNIKDFMRDTLPKIMAMVPAKDRAEGEAKMAEPVPGIGMTMKQMLEKLDLRLGMFVRLDPTQQIPIPDSPPLPGADGVLVVDGLGWLIDALKPQFMPLLQSPQSPSDFKDEGGVLTLRIKNPLAPAPMDFQPVLRYDSKTGRVLIASRPALFDAIVNGTEKFTQRADFAEIWRNLPQEGNDCIFLSKRYLQMAGDYFATAAKKPGAGAPPNPELIAKMLEWAKPLLNRNQVVVLGNLSDGIQTTSNLGIAIDSSMLTTLTTISILSSLAVPTFSKIQQKGDQTHEISKAKQVAAALVLHASSHGGKYPEKLSDLTVDDPKILQCTDPVSKGSVEWVYMAKTSGLGSSVEILLVSPPYPDGKRIAAYSDTSAKLITEAEFAVQKAKW